MLNWQINYKKLYKNKMINKISEPQKKFDIQ